jgi:hypothetical protein
LRFPRLVPTPRADEPTEVGQSATHKIQHPDDGFGAFGVLLNQVMPLAAVGAVQFITSLKALDFHVADPRCRGGQARSANGLAFVLHNFARQRCGMA